ncbi:Arsb [Symbiodinium sp. CCMP2592]|nr:Arsb [Symbiodinium sp. CCMP2592]
MKPQHCLCLTTAVVAFATAAGAGPASRHKPHILFILADDMGWANIGYHRNGSQTADEKQGQLEVHTPAINALAAEGVVLDRHYSYRICGPARSALLSGRLAPHVLVKNVAVTAQNPEDPVSGFAGIPRNMTGMGAKVKAGGYKTFYTGKWDAGMATPQHTPRGRGFDSSFLYYQHANDYWNKKTGIQATGEITPCLNAFYDLVTENDTYRGPYKEADLTDACKDSEERTPFCYEEKMFEERSLQIIRDHNASDLDHPLFLFHAFHLLHTPLQIPKYYYSKISEIVSQQGGQIMDSENRRKLMAMTMYLDDTIKNLTDALKSKGMWDNTLLVFTTDNGGPIYEPGSANNYPLRGGKYSDFEGGVRTNTFISGGFIPESSRGRIHNGIVSIADWYTIFSELAGVDPKDDAAEAANVWLKSRGLSTLAPVDGKNGMLDAIFQGAPGPRANESLFISANALLSYPYKLVTGKQPYMVHTGPLYPNCSTVGRFVSGGGPDFVDFGVLEYKIDLGDEYYWRGDCGDGCLYNIEEDPSESHDLSHDPKYQAQLKQMIATLADFNKTLFLPERGETDVKVCYSIMLNGGGHFGPFVDIKSYYSDPPRSLDNLTKHEKLQMTAMGITEIPPVKELIQEYLPKLALTQLRKTSDKCCPEPDSCTLATEPDSLDETGLVFDASHKLTALDTAPNKDPNVYI